MFANNYYKNQILMQIDSGQRRGRRAKQRNQMVILVMKTYISNLMYSWDAFDAKTVSMIILNRYFD